MPQVQELLIAGGANGSGKTTFALEYLASHDVIYLSADAIAEEFSPDDPTASRIKAGRHFLKRLDSAIESQGSMLIESTLSGRGIGRVLRNARNNGFVTTITYFYLDSPEACVARVQERVRKGGHDVLEPDVRRRFWRSIRNFWSIYRHLADEWVLVYNVGGQFQDVAAGKRDTLTVRDSGLLSRFMTLVARTEDVGSTTT